VDTRTFDDLSRRLGVSTCRRGTLKRALAGALAAAGVASLLGSEEAAATACFQRCKQKGSRRAKKQCRERCAVALCRKTAGPQVACSNSKRDCCTVRTKYVCGTSRGKGANTCCGPQGATCSTSADCCSDQCCTAGKCAPGGAVCP
jgi:hypothetical protein